MTHLARALALKVLTVSLLFVFLAGTARAQESHSDARAEATHPKTVSALMVSDIHFEPFWDPTKAAQLESAPSPLLGRNPRRSSLGRSPAAIRRAPGQMPCPRCRHALRVLQIQPHCHALQGN